MDLPVPERDPSTPVTAERYDALVRAVNTELWPELRDLRQRVGSTDVFPDDEFDPGDYK